MKKTSLLVLLLCACLLLTACTATDPDNLFELPQDTVSNTENTKPNSEKDTSYTGSYQYGNMYLDGNFMLLGNEVVFSHNEDGKTRLYAYDLNTEEVRFYCDDATCKHGGCVVAKLWFNLEVYKGKLYGMVWPSEASASIKYPAVAEGNTAEIIIPASARRFFHYDDKLYIHTADSSFVSLEEGQTDPQMVVEEFTGWISMIFGEYLYSQKNDDSVIRLHLTDEEPLEELLLSNVWSKIDGEHIYYTDNNNDLLYRCAMDGSNPERLQKGKVGGFNFDDEYIYYRIPVSKETYQNLETCDIYRFPKDDPTKTEKIATLPDPVGVIYTVPGTGKIFVENYIPDSSVKPVVYVMNTDGSDLKQLELPED